MALRKTRLLAIAAAVATVAAVTGIVILNGSASANTAAPKVLSADCAKPVAASTMDTEGGVGTMATPPFPTRSWTSAVDSAQRIAPSGGEALVRGSAHFKLPFFTYYAQLDELTSCVAWLGDSPVVPDRITHTDRWHVDYVGTQLYPVGTPADAKITADGGSVDVVYTTTVTGTWQSQHAVPAFGIFPTAAHSYSGVFRVSHEVTAEFQFGSSTVTVTGQDRAFTG